MADPAAGSLSFDSQTGVAPHTATKPQRVLACVQCQHRKIKCDRKVPCANCIRASVKCIPSTAPRPRRQRFPERELLNRLRHYESLLRQHNIDFEPLHPQTLDRSAGSSNHRRSPDVMDTSSADSPPGDLAKTKQERKYDTKTFWNIITQRFPPAEEGDDDYDDESVETDGPHETARQVIINKALDQLYGGNDHLLFGLRKTEVNLSTMHPNQVQIFRLWQAFVDNVNPILKVTHIPTLQLRILDAASDVSNIDQPLEALMFSIYCTAVLSMEDSECQALFQLPKQDLLTNYQFGCQQALLNCGIFRTDDRDSLTAFLLYLISVRPDTDPRSLSSMLGTAIRIAQGIGIHSEAANTKFPPLEAELRRRLWWALVIFDTRMSEMAPYRAAILAPIWDCKTPLNINDFDIRPDMSGPPPVRMESTDAIFAVVRAEMADFIRHCPFYLDFVNPGLKPLVKPYRLSGTFGGDDLHYLEKRMQDRYLNFCDPDNPLHYATIWSMRAYLAKNLLIENYSLTPSQLTDAQLQTAVSLAQRMLDCDTKLQASSMVKKFQWFLVFQFPFPAYIHLVQDVRKRPLGEVAEKSWQAMSDNYEARFSSDEQDDSIFAKVFYKFVIQAWSSRERALGKSGLTAVLPPMISTIRRRIAQRSKDHGNEVTQDAGNMKIMDNEDLFSLLPPVFGGWSLRPDSTEQAAFDYSQLDLDTDKSGWTAVDWDPMQGLGW